MITIMTTKAFLNAIDDAYAKGVSAGACAEALKNREDQNRRLHEIYQYGKAAGMVDAYTASDIEEIDGEIDLADLVDDVADALEA